MRFAGCNHIIVRFVLLQHQPHGFDVFLGIPPITLGVQVAQIKFVFETGENIAAARVILRVTKASPRRGDSWLKRIPLLACKP